MYHRRSGDSTSTKWPITNLRTINNSFEFCSFYLRPSGKRASLFQNTLFWYARTSIQWLKQVGIFIIILLIYLLFTPPFESTILGLWGMWSTPSLPLFLSLLWLGVVTPDRNFSMDQIKFLTFKLHGKKWLMLKWIVKNRTTWSFNCVWIYDWWSSKSRTASSNIRTAALWEYGI